MSGEECIDVMLERSHDMDSQMHTEYSKPQKNATCEMSVNLKVELFLSFGQ